ncbi:MAG: PKD domain-containing protein [Chitinophagales bacterium]|nr:PKD domain-containing protein [Chitinophagales bacterium]MBP9548126.1 PKD domain-containing protein [Chitinophagales bacterium]
MRKQIIFLCIGLLLAGSGFSQTTKSVLFLGNSYTSVNNLPQMVSNVATSAGDTLIYDSNSPGGFTFQGHTTNITSLNKIMVGDWDFVVLQEQSQLPSFPIDQVESEVFPYAHMLDSIINTYNACGETMFYMTWGRKNGDAGNCPVWPPVCTYAGMDSLLHLRYMMMAEDNHAVVSPVGAVWNYIRANFPLIELYSPDESHPSVAGSYAAACCFYTSIFRKNPELITDDYGLSPVDAANIRSAVKTIVYDDFLEWHIGEYDPIADFSFDVSEGTEVTFTNLSANAINYEWNFGDGNTSTETNPIYTYTSSGTYTITLIANYCSYSDTMNLSVTIVTTRIDLHNIDNIISIYPNPVSDQLIMNVTAFDKIAIINSIGQNFTPNYSIIGENTNIDFSTFAPGIYFLSITIDGKIFTQKILKQE